MTETASQRQAALRETGRSAWRTPGIRDRAVWPLKKAGSDTDPQLERDIFKDNCHTDQ